MIYYQLSDYLKLLEDSSLLCSYELSDKTKTVRGVSFDSRDIPEDCIFIAKGLHFKAEYLDSAFEKGALCYVSDHVIEDRGERIIVNDVRAAMSVLARFFYHDPQTKLQTFAITGTKGKTTSSAFLRRILDFDAKNHGKPGCAISCSVDIWDGKTWTEPINTTPEAPDIWKYMANAAESHAERFVLEVSSQALKYGRVSGMTFDFACFTNVGFDHIGPAEHTDFEDYLNSKLTIFDHCRHACVNIDDAYAGRMIEKINSRYPVVTFGTSEKAEVRMTGVKRLEDGIHFTITTPQESCEMLITMPGLFNASNALYAIAMAYSAGIPLDTCRRALEEARVKGRMLSYPSKDGQLTVIIDYAHNGMSFETLFGSLELEYPGAALVAIYGWHGNKGQNRRHDIGVVTGARADFTVITEKDSADEAFEDIAADAAQWIASVGGKYAIVKDREDALRYAFGLDFGERRKIIVFAGRGEEDWQKWGNTYYKYQSDPEITEKLLSEYNSTHTEK